MNELTRKQSPDGGWPMEALGPFAEHPKAPPAQGSNSYATGLAAFAMEKAGVDRSNPALVRALGWLRSHQDKEHGYWAASSMNKTHPPEYMPALFMRDAATGFATLALLD